MAKYCPECGVGVKETDKACGSCGYVLDKIVNLPNDPTGGAFKEESKSNDFVSKGYISAESVSDENSAKEIVADEIIADGIADPEKFVKKTDFFDAFTGGAFKEENDSKEFVSEKKAINENGADVIFANEIVADEIIASGKATNESVTTGTVIPDTVSTNTASVKPPVYTKAPIVPQNAEKAMSLGDWMITLLLLFIPIVNIVMLIVWSVDSKTSETKKHFAWAYLIYMAIGIVLSIIFSSILISIILASLGSMAY